MNLQSEKLQLMERILQTKDISSVRLMNEILDVSASDPWDTYSQELKASIERGLNDIEEGKIIPHEEVMKKYKRWTSKSSGLKKQKRRSATL